MAASDAGLGFGGAERFDALSREIEMKFNELQSLLNTKKAQLLDRVRKMKELDQKLRDIAKSIQEMSAVRKATIDGITVNLIAECKEQVTSWWEDKISGLRRERDELDSVCELKFVPNSIEVSASINKIHLRDYGTVEFDKRREPLVMTGKRGGSEEEIGLTCSIAVDGETDRVFVVDFYKQLVSIYSLEGEFIKNFGKGKLGSPYGISLSEKFVFVTSRSTSSVVKFLKSGEFVCDTDSQNKDTQLDSPHNLCVHNHLIYVCNSGKHRIELFNSDLLFIQSFGDSKLYAPEDIEVYNDIIFVLTQVDQSVHTFNTQHEFIISIPLTGPNNSLISNAFFFTIDLQGNFFISDRNAGCLKIFSQTGQYIDSLGEGYITIPQGIDLDKHNRILSVCISDFNTFQIY